MEERLCSKLICKATKGLRDRYKILHHQVRIHNKNLKKKKGTKVIAKAIRKYIMTGMTTSEKLLKLKQTQPNIARIIQTCIPILQKYGYRKEGYIRYRYVAKINLRL